MGHHPTTLPDLVNDVPALRRFGRYLDADVLLETGTTRWMLRIRDGEILHVRAASPVMESFSLALRFDANAWERFLEPVPPPGYHDLMALIRHRHLRVEGDLHPFMSHLFWFKGALASLRGPAA